MTKKSGKAVSSRTVKTATHKTAKRIVKPTTARKVTKPVVAKNGNSKNGSAKNGSTKPAPVKAQAKAPVRAPKPLLSQKETLQQERANVETELERLRAELQEAPEMTGDEVDLNVYEREKTLGLVATYERRLEEIQATIQVAAEGKYGICERCGKKIDPERLQIFPETRLCVDCKNETEREQRRLRLG